MAEKREYVASLQARFVDDHDLVRSGRALLEVDGHEFVKVPVPDGWTDSLNQVEKQATTIENIAKNFGSMVAVVGQLEQATAAAEKASTTATQAAGEAEASASAAASSESTAGYHATDASGHAQAALTEANRSSSEADRAEAGASMVGDAQAVLTARDEAVAAAGLVAGAEVTITQARDQAVQAVHDTAEQVAHKAPRIEGGTWWIGDEDTGVPAQGPPGDGGSSVSLVEDPPGSGLFVIGA